MQNANYDLLKMLLTKLDDTWRVEKYYAEDARKYECKECAELMKKIAAEDQRHLELLKKELERHVKEGNFD